MELLNKLKKMVKKEPPKKPTARMMTVLMQDGTSEQYPKTFFITDGINALHYSGDVFHYCFDCDNLRWEMANREGQLKGVYVTKARHSGMHVCPNCDRNIYLYRHGREDEMT